MAKQRPKQVSEMSDEELLGFKEQGAEEEATPFEMVKPFKKAAIANAGMEGSAPGNALDAMLPDSPMALAGQASRGIKGIGKFMGALPKAAGASKAPSVLGSTQKFGKDAPVQAGADTLGYGHNPLPVMGQISEETAKTIDYKKMGGASAAEPMWKQKLREQGKLVIRKK